MLCKDRIDEEEENFSMIRFRCGAEAISFIYRYIGCVSRFQLQVRLKEGKEKKTSVLPISTLISHSPM